MKYDIVVSEENKHVVELEHFNQREGSAEGCAGGSAGQHSNTCICFGTKWINNTLH